PAPPPTPTSSLHDALPISGDKFHSMPTGHRSVPEYLAGSVRTDRARTGYKSSIYNVFVPLPDPIWKVAGTDCPGPAAALQKDGYLLPVAYGWGPSRHEAGPMVVAAVAQEHRRFA